MYSIYYCPNCGNATVLGVIEIFGQSFEAQERITKTVKEKIDNGGISPDEQKLCFICEEAEKRRYSKKLEKGQQNLIYCMNCFDWRISDVWQKFTFPQKESLRLLFLKRDLYLNADSVDECPRCVEINAFARERTANVCNDSY